MSEDPALPVRTKGEASQSFALVRSKLKEFAELDRGEGAPKERVVPPNL